jgi:hypothetical protein
MKKNIASLLILLLLNIAVGCSSGGSSKRPDETSNKYYYKWTNGISSISASAYTKSSSIFNSLIVYADNEGETNEMTYLGPEIPPFASLDDGNRMCGFLLILTYYGNVLVNSTCTCNPDDGEITEYDLSGTGNLFVPSFIAKKQGVFNITATYNNETLNIPVRIYHFGTINLPEMDLDDDGILDIENFKANYGYQVISNSYLSLISSAPAGDYLENTPLTQFIYNKIYIIKTSSNKYCKIWPTGYCGENAYNCVDCLSDVNGNFDY